jgi:fructosamine-3-kinase
VIPAEVVAWLEENGFGEATSQEAVSGGCISNGSIIDLNGADSFFLKVNSNAPKDMFQREAEGLDALRNAHGPRFPNTFLIGDDFLLLEDLKPATPAADYWESLGRQLARLHQHTKSQFGFDQPNYIGSTAQPNDWTESGYDFFGEHRLAFQVRLARDKALLSRTEAGLVDQLAAKLPELIPDESSSLIHGDLWSGNVISDAEGQPALIDPAAHYGWREAELGMTQLFGSFDTGFYESYHETFPLEEGWQSRLPIYNVYHLLNHLNIFGLGYHAQVMKTLQQFS